MRNGVLAVLITEWYTISRSDINWQSMAVGKGSTVEYGNVPLKNFTNN